MARVKDWVVVANPVAGRGRTRRLLPRLAAACERRCIPVHVASSPEESETLARLAFERGRGVLACGGDGTVAQLAAIASELDGALGIVPTGAGNDFARHLGIDHRRPLDALKLVDHGHVVSVDLGLAHTADGRQTRFTTVAHTGFDTEANRWANTVRWATGRPLYVLAMLRTLVTYRQQPLQVTVDGLAWQGDAWLAAVGSTRSYGGGMRITPAAEIDDGTFDVCVIGGLTITTFLSRFPSVFRGRHVDVEGVETFRGKVIDLAAPDARLPLELWANGERIGPLPARLVPQPRALRVLGPSADQRGPATGR